MIELNVQLILIKIIFRWELSPQDLETIKKYRILQEPNVEIRKEDLKKHLGVQATDYIFGVGGSTNKIN